MSDFEDFEMKPLTKGLGFHKKSINLKEEMAESELLSEKLGRELPTTPPPSLFEEKEEVTEQLASTPEIEITQPLPRAPKVNRNDFELPVTPANDEYHDIFEDLPRPKTFRETPLKKPVVEKTPDTGVRRSSADSPKQSLKPLPFSFVSSLMDGVVVAGIALIFLVSLLLITGVSLQNVLASASADSMIQLVLLFLYVSVLQIYTVILRSYMGATLGEWTFDCQLGDDAQINSTPYPFLVIWRSLLNVITGFVVLPFLSVITRRDVSSYLTGLQLYRRQ